MTKTTNGNDKTAHNNITPITPITHNHKSEESEKSEEIAIAWLRLARCSGAGASRVIRSAVRSGAFGSPFDIIDKVLQAKKLADNAAGNGGSKSKIFIPSESDARREMKLIEAFGAKFIHVGHSLYPPILCKIANPVIGLTVKGNLSLLGKNGSRFAIVGTRTPSVASVCLVKNFVEGLMSLSKLGGDGNIDGNASVDGVAGVGELCIVSGLAYGIDSASHRYAIDYSKNCSTIGVIGCGINMCYPFENALLQEKIGDDGGLLVSEFEFGSQPTKYTFPLRNRIIAAISDGVLVMEAKSGSGSLITAKYANEFGVPLFSIAGSPIDARYSGNNALIKSGKAKMVDSADDIMSGIANRNIAWSLKGCGLALGLGAGVSDGVGVGCVGGEESECFGFASAGNANCVVKEPEYELDEDYIDAGEVLHGEKLRDRIAKAMSSVPVSVPQICEALNASNKDVALALVDLELDNVVEKDENGMFCLNFRDLI